MNDLKVKILSPQEWEIYKQLRLDSLKDSPDAFGSTYELESGFKDKEWISRLNRQGKENLRLPLIATHNDAPIGLAFGLCHSPKDTFAHVYQMWVSPKARGLGAGRRLLNQIIFWAKASQFESLLLAVTTTNTPAIHLYHALGFEDFGETEALREDSPLYVQPMRLNLTTHPG